MDARDQPGRYAPQGFFPDPDASQVATGILLLAPGQSDVLGPPRGRVADPPIEVSRDLNPGAILGSGEHQPRMHAAADARKRPVIGHRWP